MKLALIAAVALATAMPVVSIPVVSDAQVLTGRGTAPRRAPRPALSPIEQGRLFEAQDLVMELDGQIEDIQTAGEAAGGLTAEQTAQIQQHTTRRAEAQRTVERLENKRDRRS
ncbi:hypothetical protein [Brevundimonas sp.]